MPLLTLYVHLSILCIHSYRCYNCISDGLTDCGDSKCCSHPSCKNNIMCMYLADPVDVLLRKPPPTVAASFLSRVRFLFEGEESVQNYAKLDTFDDK